MPIVKSVLTVTFLRPIADAAHIDDIVNNASLTEIAYEIDEGDWLGSMEITHQEIVPPEKLEAEQIALGSDGTFFTAD